MKDIIIGVDLAKAVFQLHGAAAVDGRPLFRKKLSRGQFLRFVSQHPEAVVAVSYTHLDVYKRQPLSMTRFNRIYTHLKSMADLRDGRRNFEVAVSHWRADASWFHLHQIQLVEKFRAV